MNTSTLNLTTISLQASVSSPDQIISISGGIFLSEPASSLNVTLIEYDLNLLKFSNQLATNSQNTFLSTLDNTVRDMSGIPNIIINNESRRAVKNRFQWISGKISKKILPYPYITTALLRADRRIRFNIIYVISANRNNYRISYTSRENSTISQVNK